MACLTDLRVVLDAAIDRIMLAVSAAPRFRAHLVGHLRRLADQGLQNPEWYVFGLPLGLTGLALPAPKGFIELLAGCLCHFAGLDALDDVMDDDLSNWSGVSPAEVVNAGQALLFAGQVAFRQAGCQPATLERLLSLSLETAAGQSLDLAMDATRLSGLSVEEHLHIHGLKTGKTLELFTRATCDLLPLEPTWVEEMAAWARDLGVYLQLLGDERSLRDRPSVDLQGSKPSLAVLYVLESLPEPERKAFLDDLEAYPRGDDARTRVHAALERDEIRRHVWHRLDERRRDLVRRVEELVPATDRTAFLDMILPLAGAHGEPDEAPSSDEVGEDPGLNEDFPEVAFEGRVTEALLHLTFDPDLIESHDTHRWGFLGHPVLVGDVFPMALVCTVLGDTGHDTSALRGRLLDRRSPDGWRYFPELAELPPDCDVLGQLLQAFAPGDDRARRAFEAPISHLLSSIDPAGGISVWMPGPGETTALSAARWQGNGCIAAIANAYQGLVAWAPRAHRTTIERGIDCLLTHHARHDDWVNFWYIPAYARMVCARLLASGVALDNGELSRSRAIRLTLDATARRVLSERRADGAWNGHLETALAITTLVHCGQPQASWARALERLASGQREWGGWTAEALYRTPSREGGLAWYGSRCVTTALCMQAIRLASRPAGLQRRPVHA